MSVVASPLTDSHYQTIWQIYPSHGSQCKSCQPLPKNQDVLDNKTSPKLTNTSTKLTKHFLFCGDPVCSLSPRDNFGPSTTRTDFNGLVTSGRRFFIPWGGGFCHHQNLPQTKEKKDERTVNRKKESLKYENLRFKLQQNQLCSEKSSPTRAGPQEEAIAGAKQVASIWIERRSCFVAWKIRPSFRLEYAASHWKFLLKTFQCKNSGFFQVILTRKYKKGFKWKDPKKFFLECMSLNHSVFLGRLQLHPKKTPPSEVQRRQWWLVRRRPRRVARFPPATSANWLKWPWMPRTSQL